MIGLSKLLKEVIAEAIAKTNLGQRVHFIVEAESDVDSYKKSLMGHIAKMVLGSTGDKRDRAGWIETLTRSVGNIRADKFFSKKTKLKDKALALDFIFNEKTERYELDPNEVLRLFEYAYDTAKREMDKGKGINSVELPKKASEESKRAILFYYRNILASLLVGDGRDFIDNPEKYI